MLKKYIEEKMSEVSSSMEIQGYLFAPKSAYYTVLTASYVLAIFLILVGSYSLYQVGGSSDPKYADQAKASKALSALGIFLGVFAIAGLLFLQFYLNNFRSLS